MPEPVLRARPVVLQPPADSGPPGLPALSVTVRDGARLLALSVRRGRTETLRHHLSARLGIDLPDGPRRCVAGPLALVGTGPGSWLMTADHDQPGFAAEIAAMLDGVAAVADQSDAFVVLRLSGPALRGVLAKGVALDLHPLAFPPGAAATTVVGHIGIMLWRIDGDDLTVDLAAPRSSLGSLWTWLAGSAAEFGLAVTLPGPGAVPNPS